MRTGEFGDIPYYTVVAAGLEDSRPLFEKEDTQEVSVWELVLAIQEYRKRRNQNTPGNLLFTHECAPRTGSTPPATHR